ncbi:hypothetical protein DWV63_14045 [Enterococcus durans]|nr:hypothetical protein CJZ72_08720 [Enterococcus durans]OQO81882.1 hypothetical protein BH742_04005 [Enterococcus durans]RGW61642.1 hypothetical protein DWV63_14045 [Enterococcus durans]RYT11506.1 hypothetical protein EAI85_02105 [Enterococcus durans]
MLYNLRKAKIFKQSIFEIFLFVWIDTYINNRTISIFKKYSQKYGQKISLTYKKALFLAIQGIELVVY